MAWLLSCHSRSPKGPPLPLKASNDDEGEEGEEGEGDFWKNKEKPTVNTLHRTLHVGTLHATGFQPRWHVLFFSRATMLCVHAVRTIFRGLIFIFFGVVGQVNSGRCSTGLILLRRQMGFPG